MKHRIQWLKEQIEIRISMSTGELIFIIALLAGMSCVLMALITQAIYKH